MQEQLNKIFGTDFKVKTIDGGFKISVPSIDIVQLVSLAKIAKDVDTQNLLLKRSGKNITVIVSLFQF